PARLTGRDELQLQKGAPDVAAVCIAIRSTLGNLARGWDRWDAVTVARTVRVAKNQIDLEVFVQLIALRWVWGIRVVRIWKVGSLLRRENHLPGHVGGRTRTSGVETDDRLIVPDVTIGAYNLRVVGLIVRRRIEFQRIRTLRLCRGCKA